MMRIDRYIYQSILRGGLVAGTIDIGAACLINKVGRRLFSKL